MSDPLQHAERVPFVVSIFEPGDRALCRPDEFREVRLREASGGTLLVDHLGDESIESCFLEEGQVLRVSFNKAVQDLDHIRCLGAFFLGHVD